MKIREVKKEVRHREWERQIQDCQTSGKNIREWCRENGIRENTYYRRLRIVREELLGRPTAMPQIVPISIRSDCALSEVMTENHSAGIAAATEIPTSYKPSDEEHKEEKIIMRKDGIEIELPQKISENTLLALLRGLGQC